MILLAIAGCQGLSNPNLKQSFLFQSVAPDSTGIQFRMEQSGDGDSSFASR